MCLVLDRVAGASASEHKSLLVNSLGKGTSYRRRHSWLDEYSRFWYDHSVFMGLPFSFVIYTYGLQGVILQPFLSTGSDFLLE